MDEISLSNNVLMVFDCPYTYNSGGSPLPVNSTVEISREPVPQSYGILSQSVLPVVHPLDSADILVQEIPSFNKIPLP